MLPPQVVYYHFSFSPSFRLNSKAKIFMTMLNCFCYITNLLSICEGLWWSQAQSVLVGHTFFKECTYSPPPKKQLFITLFQQLLGSICYSHRSASSCLETALSSFSADNVAAKKVKESCIGINWWREQAAFTNKYGQILNDITIQF